MLTVRAALLNREGTIRLMRLNFVVKIVCAPLVRLHRVVVTVLLALKMLVTNFWHNIVGAPLMRNRSGDLVYSILDIESI